MKNINDSLDLVITAGETISALSPCYLKTDGKVYNASSTNTTSATFLGISTIASTSGNLIRIRNIGKLGGFSSLTGGQIQYISSTAGSLTTTAPATVLIAGIALDSSTILINCVGDKNAHIEPLYSKGYYTGGSTQNVETYYNTTAYVVDFLTQTISTQASAALSLSRGSMGCLSDISDSKGYFCGGSTYTGVVSNGDKLTYSNDTTASQTSANLSQSRSYMSSLSYNAGGKGFFCGGSWSGFSATVDKLIYSTDATAVDTTATLPVNAGLTAGVSDDVDGKGYFSGGTQGAVGTASTTYKMNYSTELSATQTTANISDGRSYLNSLSDNADGKGYFSGGTDASNATKVTDKLIFSSDTTSAQTSANLTTTANYAFGALSDNYYGYGFYSGGGLSVGQLVIYATDTTVANTSAATTLYYQGSVSGNSV